jgi:HK97 gp10 family phage protein
MIKVNVLGMDKALGDISRYAKGVGERVEQELRTTAQLVRNDAIKNAPVDQGQLRRFIVADPVRNYETAVVSQAKYSEFIEYGTGDLGKNPKGGHTSKKRWVYFDELSGEFRIARPQRPRPFMFPAAEANRRGHAQRIAKALKKK